MEREEIEHLLVDYASGEISGTDKKKLEELFRQDPLLRHEAEEMMQVWNSMRKAEENTVMSPKMDANFYAMLDTAKESQVVKGHRIIVLKPNMIRLLIASAACIAAFVIGRVSIEPQQMTRYKTVYVKQAVPAQVAVVNVPENKTEINARNENEYGQFVAAAVSKVNAELMQKLRSVYASERIAAISELSKRKSLDPSALEILGLALREDPSPNVRLAIVNTLQPLSAQKDIQDVLIAALNHQDDPTIQTSIVDLLVDAKSNQAIPQMISLLKNKNTDVIVQERIKDGIEKFLY